MLLTHDIGDGLNNRISMELVVSSYRRPNGILYITQNDISPVSRGFNLTKDSICGIADYARNSARSDEGRGVIIIIITHLFRWPSGVEVWLENLTRKGFEIHAKSLSDLSHWGHTLDVSALFCRWIGLCFST